MRVRATFCLFRGEADDPVMVQVTNAHDNKDRLEDNESADDAARVFPHLPHCDPFAIGDPLRLAKSFRVWTMDSTTGVISEPVCSSPLTCFGRDGSSCPPPRSSDVPKWHAADRRFAVRPVVALS